MDGDLVIITELGQEISEEHVRKIMFQILTSLNFIHKNGFIHRDIVLFMLI
jgi:serine/threonine protein kinase